MSSERIAVDLSDGCLAILGSSGRGKNFALKDSFVKFFDDVEPDALVNEVVAYIAREEISSPDVYLALDSRSVLVKSYFFPFRAAKKVESALEFELERSLPVKKENLFVDWIYGPRVGSGSFIAAGCAENDYLASLADAFRNAGLRLMEIVEGSVPLNRLASEQEKGNKVILDIGRERTVLYSIEKGLLRNRDLLINGVGEVISRLESQDFSFDSAYRTVFLSDFTAEDLDDDARKAADEIARLIARIKNYVQVYSEKSGFVPDVIEVCGEGGEITGMVRLIEAALEIRSVRILPHDLLTHFEDNIEASNALRAYGLLQLDKSDRLNFLRDEDKAEQGGRSKLVKYASGWAAVLLFSFIALFGGNLYYKSKRIARTEDQIQNVVSKSLPGVQADFSHAQRVSIITSRINELKRKLRNNSGGAGSAIEVLRMIHAAVHASLGVTLDELTLDPRRLALSGTAGNFQDVEALRTQLESSKFFSTVSIKGATAEKKTNKVRFTVELLRKPLGD